MVITAAVNSQQAGTAAQQQQHSMCARNITRHHVEQLIVVYILRQYMHAAIVGRAVGRAGEYTGETASSLKSRWHSSMYVLACMTRKQCAARDHVAPGCEISDGRPIAGQHVNIPVVP